MVINFFTLYQHEGPGRMRATTVREHSTSRDVVVRAHMQREREKICACEKRHLQIGEGALTNAKRDQD